MPSLQKIRLAVVMLAVFLPALYTQAAPPVVGGCDVFPASNPWNLDVSSAPLDPNSANYIANINAQGDDSDNNLHADFGSDPTYGIPFEVVNGIADVPINFDEDAYEDESDPGPMPIPGNARVEGTDDGDGDRHVLVIDSSDCKLYELYSATPNARPATSWTVFSSAIWDLNSPIVQQRPLGWTSADAAGLPIFPGLARCEEANSGTINHAFRFTVEETRNEYIYPASHEASDQSGANYPPMGLRVRLKANYDLSNVTGQALAIAEALKKYGMMLADNGSNWYISGEANPTCWDDNDEDGNDDDLNQLKDIPGIAFEVVSIVSPKAASPVQHYYTTPTALVSWDGVTWATGYEIQVSKNKNFTGTLADEDDTLTPNQSTYTTVPLDNGTYYWRVRAFGGSSSWSTTESFVVSSS
jgi:hypothetical protein